MELGKGRGKDTKAMERGKGRGSDLSMIPGFLCSTLPFLKVSFCRSTPHKLDLVVRPLDLPFNPLPREDLLLDTLDLLAFLLPHLDLLARPSWQRDLLGYLFLELDTSSLSEIFAGSSPLPSLPLSLLLFSPCLSPLPQSPSSSSLPGSRPSLSLALSPFPSSSLPLSLVPPSLFLHSLSLSLCLPRNVATAEGSLMRVAGAALRKRPPPVAASTFSSSCARTTRTLS